MTFTIGVDGQDRVPQRRATTRSLARCSSRSTSDTSDPLKSSTSALTSYPGRDVADNLNSVNLLLDDRAKAEKLLWKRRVDFDSLVEEMVLETSKNPQDRVSSVAHSGKKSARKPETPFYPRSPYGVGKMFGSRVRIQD